MTAGLAIMAAAAAASLSKSTTKENPVTHPTNATSQDHAPVITPTVGRVLWYYPHENQNEGGFVRHAGPIIEPYAAVISHVWSDHMVNLCVFDANGKPHARTSVELRHNA